MNEILGHIRPPGIEGIVRRMIPRGPVARCRDVVDVSGIFAEASPWILHIVKVVRAEHMASQAPAFGEALVEHVHGSGADLVDRADIPAEVMMARSVRARERD